MGCVHSVSQWMRVWVLCEMQKIQWKIKHNKRTNLLLCKQWENVYFVNIQGIRFIYNILFIYTETELKRMLWWDGRNVMIGCVRECVWVSERMMCGMCGAMIVGDPNQPIYVKYVLICMNVIHHRAIDTTNGISHLANSHRIKNKLFQLCLPNDSRAIFRMQKVTWNCFRALWQYVFPAKLFSFWTNEMGFFSFGVGLSLSGYIVKHAGVKAGSSV